PPRRLYPLRVPRTSALPAASFRSHLAMDTLAVRLTLPLVGHVENFHLQVSAPCRAHRSEPLSPSGRGAGVRAAPAASPTQRQQPMNRSFLHLRVSTLQRDYLWTCPGDRWLTMW